MFSHQLFCIYAFASAHRWETNGKTVHLESREEGGEDFVWRNDPENKKLHED